MTVVRCIARKRAMLTKGGRMVSRAMGQQGNRLARTLPGFRQAVWVEFDNHEVHHYYEGSLRSGKIQKVGDRDECVPRNIDWFKPGDRVKHVGEHGERRGTGVVVARKPKSKKNKKPDRHVVVPADGRIEDTKEAPASPGGAPRMVGLPTGTTRAATGATQPHRTKKAGRQTVVPTAGTVVAAGESKAAVTHDSDTDGQMGTVPGEEQGDATVAVLDADRGPGQGSTDALDVVIHIPDATSGGAQ